GVSTPLALLKAEDETPYKIVKVFFATDRRPVDPALLASRQRRLWPLVGSLALVVFGIVTAVFYSAWRRWSIGFVIAGGAAALVIVVGQRGALPVAVSTVDASGSGTVAYGNERGDLQLGECEITIPKAHREGRVERPSVWRLELKERADKHVILRRVERQPSDKFFTGVRNRVNQSPRKDLFVFIHGYNVSFDTAARRTAQMAHDLDFEGAPIFFSWPSQGGMLQYTVDENNVAWAVPHLKQFLRDLIKQSGADAINVIAHSMGNRALASAIREMSLESQANQQHFDQIVLAAPDVDAEVFRRDIAPALVKSAKHVTLYASSRDHALQASKVVHGYPRAGDSGNELVVVPGIDTIDVTDADMSILGHSYYGSSQPIVNDLESLLRRDLPAERRQWLERAERDGQVYWIFDEPAATANWKQRFMQ
ncbi:MAG TPA: alpha/beta hydrolase, partial [Pirellulaceae bacterium]|nr:alpha/beta hydrolase [Pirellulaceae bacterium]